MKAWRNVRCIICQRAVPEAQAERAMLGRVPGVPAWVCRRCARDPEAALRERRERRDR